MEQKYYSSVQINVKQKIWRMIDMKKIIGLLLASVMVLTLFAGCSSDKVEDGDDNNSNSLSGGNTADKIDYSIVDKPDIPEEVKDVVNEMKTKGGYKAVKVNDLQYVFIGLGERKTGGYDVELVSVENANGKVKIVYKEKKPDPGDMVTMALTYPYIVVEIDSTLPVEVTKTDDGMTNQDKTGKETLADTPEDLAKYIARVLAGKNSEALEIISDNKESINSALPELKAAAEKGDLEKTLLDQVENISEEQLQKGFAMKINFVQLDVYPSDNGWRIREALLID